MKSFLASELLNKDQYKFLTGSIIPRPVAWVTSKSPSGVVNLAPFSFFNVVAKELPLVSISILRMDNKPKDTVVNILSNKQAVIHIVSEELIEDMNVTSIDIAYEQSEVDLTNLTLIDSDIVNVSRIKEAKIHFEAELYSHIPILDESGLAIADLLIMKIVVFHFSEEVIDGDKNYILVNKLKPVSRLSGSNYKIIKDSDKTLVRPKVK